MNRAVNWSLLPLVACFLSSVITSKASGEERMVFISAFTAGDKSAIHAYHLDLDTGKLKLLERTTDVQNPFYLALTPSRKFLYSIHGKTFGGKDHEEIAAYQVLDKGKLKLLNRQSALGSAACYLEVDKTGKALFVANYTTGSVASLPINDDGSLGKAASFVQHKGSSVDPARQKEPHAHCIVVSPDNRYVYSADLGLDQVLGYKLDAASAKIAPTKQGFAKTPPGAGPRHFTFHPDGKRAYVINELGNSITLFDYDAETGALDPKQTISTVPKDFKGTSHCADLKVTPNGRFLYGTNRGHDSIARYRLDDDGRLTLLGIEPSLGKGPQNLAITADGKWLLCANMPSDNVAVFRIDDKGGLTSAGTPISIPSPSCIRIVAKE
jgi:6-phosphogluconolactonase